MEKCYILSKTQYQKCGDIVYATANNSIFLICKFCKHVTNNLDIYAAHIRVCRDHINTFSNVATVSKRTCKANEKQSSFKENGNEQHQFLEKSVVDIAAMEQKDQLVESAVNYRSDNENDSELNDDTNFFLKNDVLITANDVDKLMPVEKELEVFDLTAEMPTTVQQDLASVDKSIISKYKSKEAIKAQPNLPKVIKNQTKTRFDVQHDRVITPNNPKKTTRKIVAVKNVKVCKIPAVTPTAAQMCVENKFLANKMNANKKNEALISMTDLEEIAKTTENSLKKKKIFVFKNFVQLTPEEVENAKNSIKINFKELKMKTVCEPVLKKQKLDAKFHSKIALTKLSRCGTAKNFNRVFTTYLNNAQQNVVAEDRELDASVIYTSDSEYNFVLNENNENVFSNNQNKSIKSYKPAIDNQKDKYVGVYIGNQNLTIGEKPHTVEHELKNKIIKAPITKSGILKIKTENELKDLQFKNFSTKNTVQLSKISDEKEKNHRFALHTVNSNTINTCISQNFKKNVTTVRLKKALPKKEKIQIQKVEILQASDAHTEVSATRDYNFSAYTSGDTLKQNYIGKQLFTTTVANAKFGTLQSQQTHSQIANTTTFKSKQTYDNTLNILKKEKVTPNSSIQPILSATPTNSKIRNLINAGKVVKRAPDYLIRKTKLEKLTPPVIRSADCNLMFNNTPIKIKNYTNSLQATTSTPIENRPQFDMAFSQNEISADLTKSNLLYNESDLKKSNFDSLLKKQKLRKTGVYDNDEMEDPMQVDNALLTEDPEDLLDELDFDATFNSTIQLNETTEADITIENVEMSKTNDKLKRREFELLKQLGLLIFEPNINEKLSLKTELEIRKRATKFSEILAPYNSFLYITRLTTPAPTQKEYIYEQLLNELNGAFKLNIKRIELKRLINIIYIFCRNNMNEQLIHKKKLCELTKFYIKLFHYMPSFTMKLYLQCEYCAKICLCEETYEFHRTMHL